MAANTPEPAALPSANEDIDPQDFLREAFGKLSDEQKFALFARATVPGGAPSGRNLPAGSPVADWADAQGNPVDQSTLHPGTVMYSLRPGVLPRKKPWTEDDVWALKKDAEGHWVWDPNWDGVRNPVELDCTEPNIDAQRYNGTIWPTPAGETVLVPGVIAEEYRRTRTDSRNALTKFARAVGMNVTGFGGLSTYGAAEQNAESLADSAA